MRFFLVNSVVRRLLLPEDNLANTYKTITYGHSFYAYAQFSETGDNVNAHAHE